jgi:hypothetical protein
MKGLKDYTIIFRNEIEHAFEEAAGGVESQQGVDVLVSG